MRIRRWNGCGKTVPTSPANIINVVPVSTSLNFHSFSFSVTEFFMPLKVPLLNVFLCI